MSVKKGGGRVGKKGTSVSLLLTSVPCFSEKGCCSKDGGWRGLGDEGEALSPC